MILDQNLLAQIAGLALLAGVGHVASLLVGVIDHTGRRDRMFGVLVLFILLCSPVFFDERPHNLAMTAFAFTGYLVGLSWLERSVATTPLMKKLMSFAIAGSSLLAVAAFTYLAMHLPVVAAPGAYALKLLSRNVALFLLLSRGAFFAYKQKELRGFVAFYALMLFVSPFLADFALAICGPLLAIGCWAFGLDLRALRRKMTL